MDILIPLVKYTFVAALGVEVILVVWRIAQMARAGAQGTRAPATPTE